MGWASTLITMSAFMATDWLKATDWVEAMDLSKATDFVTATDLLKAMVWLPQSQIHGGKAGAMDMGDDGLGVNARHNVGLHGDGLVEGDGFVEGDGLHHVDGFVEGNGFDEGDGFVVNDVMVDVMVSDDANDHLINFQKSDAHGARAGAMDIGDNGLGVNARHNVGLRGNRSVEGDGFVEGDGLHHVAGSVEGNGFDEGDGFVVNDVTGIDDAKDQLINFQRSVDDANDGLNDFKKSVDDANDGLYDFKKSDMATEAANDGLNEFKKSDDADVADLSAEELEFMIGLVEKESKDKEELAERLRVVDQPSEGDGRDQTGASLKGGGANVNKNTRELLEQISRDLWERKATKADDADIPEYLWEEHLVDDNAQHWTAKDRVGLPRAIDMM
jgi:hypothetical protein